MVSPLQTWQHPESKRLWFILGGLSVLVHIGLLGLSLPYVLRLMEPSTAAVSTVPIELITVDPVSGKPIENTDSDRLSAAATATAQPEADTTTNPSAVSDSEPSSPTDPNSFSNQTTPANSPAPNTSPDPATSDPATSPSPTPPSAPSRPTRPSQPPAGTEPRSDDGSDGGSSSGAGGGSSDALNDDSGDSSGDGSSDSLPFFPGGGTLQPPGSEGTSTTVQVAALRVTSTRLDTVQDVKEQPPQLLSSTAAIALEPERVGCDRVDFSAGPLDSLTYRVAIDADSSIKTLTLQAQGGSSLSLANEKAIDCLIRSAGFTFSAAVFDGTPVLDDSLLLTLEVIESQLGSQPGSQSGAQSGSQPDAAP